jgi:hypothetical protein
MHATQGRILFLLLFGLIVSLGPGVRAALKIAAPQFAIFEIVNCHTSGSKSMALERRAAQPETLCVSAKPILTRAHVKTVEVCSHRMRHTDLTVHLTEEGAHLMEQATRRMLESPRADGERPRLGLVVNDHLMDAPNVPTIIRDGFSLGDGLNQTELEFIANAMGSRQPCRGFDVD